MPRGEDAIIAGRAWGDVEICGNMLTGTALEELVLYPGVELPSLGLYAPLMHSLASNIPVKVGLSLYANFRDGL